MPSPLSVGKREHVVSAASVGLPVIRRRPGSGSACPAPAAGRNWSAERRQLAPKPLNGNHAWRRIEAQVELVLATYEALASRSTIAATASPLPVTTRSRPSLRKRARL